MPPRQAAGKPMPPVPSKSRALVTTGPKEVVVKKHHTKRDSDGRKPTTARALVLRNGKYGAMGTGDVVLSKMSGREKLDLLAEDLTARYAQALATPFNLEKSLRIAESQFLAYLDEIHDLRDATLFKETIAEEVAARKPIPPPQANKKKAENKDWMKDANFVAQTIASKIHNTYLLASAWRLAIQFLEITFEPGADSNVRGALKTNTGFRQQYLVLYDLVNKIVDVNQQKFALLATTAPHWSGYLQENPNKDDMGEEFVFNWALLKSVHKSFLDSIVVELCLPRSGIPRQILLQILHEAIDESPRGAKQFPQELWDAMGDLATAVQLFELLESPLLGPEGEEWKKEPRQIPEDLEQWADAQLSSSLATKMCDKYANLVTPSEKLQEQYIVDTIWKYTDLNYQSVSGKGIDALWQIEPYMNRRPTWHAKKAPEPKTNGKPKPRDDSDDDEPPSLVPYTGKRAGKKGTKKPLAITAADHDDSDGSMPSLQTVSDTSEEEEDDDSDEEESDDEEDSEDEDEAYDEDEEDAMRELIREAMDIATADPDFYNPRSEARDFQDMAQDKKDNPFLKLLGSLRGRMFSASSTLKTTDRAAPRTAYTGPKPPASAYTPEKPAPKPKAAPAAHKASQKAPQPKSHKATVEDASDDEEQVTTAAKKKKKKPKKKKKKAASTTAEAGEGGADDAEVPVPQSPQPAAAASPKPVPAAPAVPTSPPPAKKAPTPKSPVKPTPKSPTVRSAAAVPPPFGSTTSLPLATETQAQSARTYLRKEGLLNEEKTKIKTRSDQPNLFSNSEKKSIFSKFNVSAKKDKKEEREDKEGDKHSFFSKMTKKTKTYMHQLLHSAEDEKQGLGSLKWEHFLKVMREMGFSYDPSTAGSSVRFDPPDPRDSSITFHRPHPDPTLKPYKIREFGRRLQRTYAWFEADFYKNATSAQAQASAP